MNKKTKRAIGGWAFLIGVVLSLCVGVFVGILGMNLGDTALANTMAILMLAGIIIGLFNITEKEVAPFLFSGVVLIVASALGGGVSSMLPERIAITWAMTLGALMAIFVPATIIVAIKHVFAMAKD